VPTEADTNAFFARAAVLAASVQREPGPTCQVRYLLPQGDPARWDPASRIDLTGR
jgi:hypothetical protein